jgi:hypothetical protein
MSIWDLFETKPDFDELFVDSSTVTPHGMKRIKEKYPHVKDISEFRKYTTTQEP